MSRFIELKSTNGKSHVYINVANIAYVEESTSQTIVHICAGSDSLKSVYVKEDYKTIISMIDD